MTAISRTRKSVWNSSAAMGMYFINLVLEFYSRVIFLKYLGTEILGLNTTAVNLLQFLNLAEMGVWTAIATSLYKPLHENNYDEINRIVTLNGHLYRRIGGLIILAAAVLMGFFPFIFKKMELPLWYAYASFSVLLFSSLIGYFFNYKQFLLSANQQNYKIIFSYKLVVACKVVAQILAMELFPYPYFWWLGLEVGFACIASFSLHLTVKKTFPALEKCQEGFKTLRKKYPEIIKKIKQLFVQKISGFVLFQTSPIIIYGLSTLTLVTLYGNYMILINGIISLLSAMFNGMLAGIGNLVHTSEKGHILKVFDQLFAIRFYVIGVLCFGMWHGGQLFISWWLGAEYLLEPLTLGLLVAQFFFYVNRYVVYDFLSAYGYFGDVWASIAEVVINIGLSVWLGILWGLNGVIAGVLISIVIIAFGWKPFYLFKYKLKTGFGNFWAKMLNLSVTMAAAWIATGYIAPFFPTSAAVNLGALIINVLPGVAIFTIIYGLLLWLTSAPFRAVIHRFV
ncbi:MAG: sugar transporter [Muribaculaceae bacterium]|nr:sugar transporter [Muribaculaceae bacterium]